MRIKDTLYYALPSIWEILKIVCIPNRLNRIMIRGKLRRLWLVYFRRSYMEQVLLPKRKEGCKQRGACCEMGFGCPAFDDKNRLCKIHPHKPLVCQYFPITPEDLEDRNLVLPDKLCGYSFD